MEKDKKLKREELNDEELDQVSGGYSDDYAERVRRKDELPRKIAQEYIQFMTNPSGYIERQQKEMEEWQKEMEEKQKESASKNK